MKADLKQIAKALYLESQGKKSKEIDQLIDNALLLLKENGLASKAGKFIEELEAVRRVSEKKVLVTVTAKANLSKDQIKKIETYVKDKTNLEPEVEEIVDENMIGGLKINYQDSELDLSVNKQLQTLKQHLQI